MPPGGSDRLGSTAEVHGRCEPGFEPLRRALGDVARSGFEVGAALAVHVGRQQVVDIWAGHGDAACGIGAWGGQR